MRRWAAVAGALAALLPLLACGWISVWTLPEAFDDEWAPGERLAAGATGVVAWLAAALVLIGQWRLIVYARTGRAPDFRARQMLIAVPSVVPVFAAFGFAAFQL